MSGVQVMTQQLISLPAKSSLQQKKYLEQTDPQANTRQSRWAAVHWQAMALGEGVCPWTLGCSQDLCLCP